MTELPNWQTLGMSEYIAASLKGRTGCIGQVRSVHSRLINVVMADGELLTIQGPERMRTPMSLVVHWPVEVVFEPDPGQLVYWREKSDCLLCGSYTIALTGAELFGSFAEVKPGKDSAKALQVLEGHFAKVGRNQSVYDFLQQKGAIRSGGNTWPHCYGIFLQQRVRELTEAMQEGNVEECVSAAIRLVGVGPGLTPAGDDFLQGFFFYTRTFAGLSKTTDAICTNLQVGVQLDTTEVSRAYWRHFLNGRVAEPLQWMVEAFNAEDWSRFSRQVEQVSRIGHSSGDDYLSGVWQALKMGEGSGSG